MNYEDEEFNRIEMESRIRKEAVLQALHNENERLGLYKDAYPEQEPVACVQDLDEVKRKHLVYEKGMDWKDPLYTTPPQRNPLTHEQRFDLLTKFEPHKNKWEAPAILIDMVEAAHNIKE